MRILIYTRPPDHGSSITRAHWDAALSRNQLSDLPHRLHICHSETDLRDHLPDVQLIVSSKADLRANLSRNCADLRMIFFAFAGVNHLAPFDWVPSGAFVVNNSGASAEPVGDYTIFAMQLLANGLVSGDRDAFATAASQHGFARLAGKRVTIIGAGGLGRGIAARCGTFRMRVCGVRRSGAPAPDFEVMHSPSELEAAVAGADFLVIACPVTAETRDLVDAAVIGRMKAGSFLINVARGGLLDEEALCDAVASRAIGGAVLDVVRPESADPSARVRNTPGILVTPHVSGDDPCAYIDRSLDVLMANLRQLMGGETPANAIDFDLGY